MWPRIKQVHEQSMNRALGLRAHEWNHFRQHSWIPCAGSQVPLPCCGLPAATLLLLLVPARSAHQTSPWQCQLQAQQGRVSLPRLLSIPESSSWISSTALQSKCPVRHREGEFPSVTFPAHKVSRAAEEGMAPNLPCSISWHVKLPHKPCAPNSSPSAWQQLPAQDYTAVPRDSTHAAFFSNRGFLVLALQPAITASLLMSALLHSLQHSAWKIWDGTLATPKKEHRMGLYIRTVTRHEAPSRTCCSGLGDSAWEVLNSLCSPKPHWCQWMPGKLPGSNSPGQLPPSLPSSGHTTRSSRAGIPCCLIQFGR